MGPPSPPQKGRVWARRSGLIPLTLEVPQPCGAGLHHFPLLFGLTEGPLLLVWTAVGRGDRGVTMPYGLGGLQNGH